MKGLVDFINEELDRATLNKINALRERNKKEALVAIKKGLSKKSDEDLRSLAERTYETAGNYKDQDDFWEAVERGDVGSYDELEKLAEEANGGKAIDGDKLMDVIELLANGQSLDKAIAIVAKKI